MDENSVTSKTGEDCMSDFNKNLISIMIIFSYHTPVSTSKCAVSQTILNFVFLSHYIAVSVV